MVATENYTINYFRAPKDHFWHWTDNGTVIVWQNGNTICYREDLFSILQQLNSGLPPLSPLLLLLTACARPLHVQVKFILMREVKEFTGNDENSSLHKTLDDALKFLDIVAELPANLRTSQKRVHLIYELFAGTSFTFDNSQLRNAMLELNSGILDNNVFHLFSEKISEGDFLNCLLYFCTALQRYPTLQSLTVKLRTGLDKIPNAAPLLLPETETGSLYDQLLRDKETTGIARLAKRITAALNIPMQSKGRSDQPFGGISDITNRGNYDKLLLSELAHDDDLLMARLVNNEALYFRREEPPQEPKMQRVILMDTTLKMWGTSRVFALAAGLAFAGQNKHVETVATYSLGGTVFSAVSFNSKHGVVQALEKLDSALHCGLALEAVIASTPPSAKLEYIFITHARLLHHPAFYVCFTKVKQMLSFVITVADNGELQLYEYVNGISKLISSAKIDVDEMLTVVLEPKEKRDNIYLPAFLTQEPFALYYPPLRIKPIAEKMFIPASLGIGAIVVNETQRVFMSVEKGKAVVELLSYIEKGSYHFGIDSHGEINILVSNAQRKLLKLYKINRENLESRVIDLPLEIGTASTAIFRQDSLYIDSEYGAYIYDCVACVIVDKKPQGTFHDLMRETLVSNEAIFKKFGFHKFFDKQANVFYRVKSIHINKAGRLVVGKHELFVRDKLHISFKENDSDLSKIKEAKLEQESLNLLQNKNLIFSSWIWDDGSEAIVDPRGFLHLRSSDKNLAEITIIIVLGRVTACWASDNSVCGSSYYLNEKVGTLKIAGFFYDDYIQKFIDRL